MDLCDVRTQPLQQQMVPRWCTQATFQRAECQTGSCVEEGDRQRASLNLFLSSGSVQVFDGGQLANKHPLSFSDMLLQFCLKRTKSQSFSTHLHTSCFMWHELLWKSSKLQWRWFYPIWGCCRCFFLSDVFTAALLITQERWMYVFLQNSILTSVTRWAEDWPPLSIKTFHLVQQEIILE